MASLAFRRSPLADPENQTHTLDRGSARLRNLERFSGRLRGLGLFPLRPLAIDTLQVNLGKMCNQACHHCHVDAGPDRKEIMTRETMERCLGLLEETDAAVVDLTGGAPEMNPHFRWFVGRIRALGRTPMVRCNLTILTANRSYEDLPRFFAEHGVHVVSSLPCYSKENTDQQRGNGVFNRSIEALRRLNEAGYGKPGSGLTLDLVYNPVGAFLPGSQAALERDYKRELERRFGVVFNSLFTITNMPISRFLEYLVESGNLERYMETLVAAFNPAAARGVMCRHTLSVSWDGYLYDCDFNQMLEMPIRSSEGEPLQVGTATRALLEAREIRVGQHCYGCTAGSGSSCTGALESSASS